MMQATALGRVGMMHDVAADPGTGITRSIRVEAWKEANGRETTRRTLPDDRKERAMGATTASTSL